MGEIRAYYVLGAGSAMYKNLKQLMFTNVYLILNKLRNTSKPVIPITFYISSLSPKHLLV